MKSSNLQALKIFKQAYKNVPAYKKFFDASGHNVSEIRTIGQFEKIPLTTKENYISQYAPQELYSAAASLPVAYASSGSSGKSSFWFRSKKQEYNGILTHKNIVSDIFGIKKQDRTLVIICFSMGIWVAGGYTFESFKGISDLGYKLTIITPGIEKEDIFNVLQNLAPSYDNIILTGYPPFLADILSEAKTKHIAIQNKLYILTAGDKFSEDFRTQLLKLYVFPKGIFSIINLYGCADAGIIGHETPSSVVIRNLALADEDLYKLLFDDEPMQPGLYQFNPETIFLESVNNELVITAETGIPLIRYNIHDIGKIITQSSISDLILKKGLMTAELSRSLKQWDFPYITVKGRTDVAVTYYALNIFPEHLKIGFLGSQVREKLTGSLFAYTTTNTKHAQKLHVNVELKPGTKASKTLYDQIEEGIFKNLTHLNMEYRKLYNVLGDKARPVVKLVPYMQGRLSHGNDGLIVQQGKKSKMVLHAQRG